MLRVIWHIINTKITFNLNLNKQKQFNISTFLRIKRLDFEKKKHHYLLWIVTAKDFDKKPTECK